MENGLLRFLFWLEDASERFVFFSPSRNSYKTLKFDFSYLLRCSARVSCVFLGFAVAKDLPLTLSVI